MITLAGFLRARLHLGKYQDLVDRIPRKKIDFIAAKADILSANLVPETLKIDSCSIFALLAQYDVLGPRLDALAGEKWKLHMTQRTGS